MKMRNVIFMCMIYFAMSSIAIGAGIGNSIIPLGHLNVAFGIEDNIILDKDFELSDEFKSFENETINQTYGKISIGVTDYINLYTKVGGVYFDDIKLNYTDGSTTDLECEYGLLWGAGGSASYPIPIIDGLSVGVDVQYNNWKSSVSEIEHSGEIASNISGKVKNREFQIALFVSQEIGSDEINITPYAGCVYNNFESRDYDGIKYETSSTSYERNWELDEAESWGLLVGTDIAGYIFGVNIEGRFITETAVTVGTSWKF